MIFGTQKNPKGPSFGKSRTINKNISGHSLKFSAPPSKDPFSNIESWEDEPDDIDLLDKNSYKPTEISDSDINKHLLWSRIYSNIWEFRGLPIIDGYCGSLTMLINLHEVDDLPVNESLLKDEILTKEAIRILQISNARDFNTGISYDPFDLTEHQWPSHIGPLNLQWVTLNNNEWLYFENQPLVENKNQYLWHIAIDEKHYLRCIFSIKRSAMNAGNPFRIENHVSKDNFLDFMYKIMETMEVNLSAESASRKPTAQSHQAGNKRPHYKLTPDQIEEAKHVMYMWSAKGFTENGKDENSDHRASPEDVSAFIENYLQPRLLPGGHPPSNSLNLDYNECKQKTSTTA
ncbi:hypothetical protein M0G74_04365 [Microbulbifer sp. CAU 1566]|uniref:hypothetical protein n=1 Tax=Microbulbifer sp. CAU 1566 TaxID=2933269 RepID=UPI0020052C18|nr:hypothetical protein [Microbulbifer sp. CAU 1566]MCK7596504.1 hypothetical protein [Microbulbifer sp. CAU 1566]